MEKKKNDLNEDVVVHPEDGNNDAPMPKQSNNASVEGDLNTQTPSERITPAKSAQQQFSAVANAPAQKKLFLLLSIIGTAVVLYFFIFRSDSGNPKQKEEQTLSSHKSAIIKDAVSVPRSSDAQVPQAAPKMPDIPPLKEPAPPAPPPAPLPPAPPLPQLQDNNKQLVPSLPRDSGDFDLLKKPFENNDAALAKQKQLEARRKSGIIVAGGGAKSNKDFGDKDGADSQGSLNSGDNNKSADNSGFLGFGDGALDGGVLKKSAAAKVSATKTEALDRTLLQGKVVFAVLETAINTDLPGTLRAVVTRDAYAEAGKNILIPKGSRLIGTYKATVAPGQTRVDIVWDRLIRPDGIDIAIGSSGIDQLGRTGVPGDVDTKIAEKLMTAFLVSYVVPVTAASLAGNQQQAALPPLQPGQIQQVQPQTPVQNAMQQGTQQGTQQFLQIAKDAMAAQFPTQATITVDQGTRINILVQKDLVFPPATMLNNTVLGR